MNLRHKLAAVFLLFCLPGFLAPKISFAQIPVNPGGGGGGAPTTCTAGTYACLSTPNTFTNAPTASVPGSTFSATGGSGLFPNVYIDGSPGTTQPTFSSNGAGLVIHGPAASFYASMQIFEGTTLAYQLANGNLFAAGSIQFSGTQQFTGAIGAGTSLYAPVSNSITSATPGTNVTSVTCATASCTNLRGTYTIVGGTATTGVFATLLWPTTSTAYVCTIIANGQNAITAGLSHSVATATGMTMSSTSSIAGVTFNVDYFCQV